MSVNIDEFNTRAKEAAQELMQIAPQKENPKYYQELASLVSLYVSAGNGEYIRAVVRMLERGDEAEKKAAQQSQYVLQGIARSVNLETYNQVFVDQKSGIRS